MSFTGTIQARCPKGCEAFEAEVWSFVRGDEDSLLRESLLAGDANLLSCPECGTLFFPEATLVYQDVRSELLAFVFPESYRAEEARWREKMRQDYAELRPMLLRDLPVGLEPVLLFGMEPLRALLAAEDDLEDEVRVAEHLCRGLGLVLFELDRSWARGLGLPWRVPARLPRGSRFSREAACRALKALLKANGRLEGYRRLLERLGSSRERIPVKG